MLLLRQSQSPTQPILQLFQALFARIPTSSAPTTTPMVT